MQQIMGNATLNKLTLMFVFDKMEVPMTENTIVDMCCSSNNWLAYMDCKQILNELVEVDYIIATQSPHQETLFSLTQLGRECLNQFYIRIPSSERKLITDFVRENRLMYRRRQEYFSDYYKNADGTYTVVLRIIEPTQPTIDLKLTLPTRQIAKSVYKRWEEKAAQVYMTLYEMLVE